MRPGLIVRSRISMTTGRPRLSFSSFARRRPRPAGVARAGSRPSEMPSESGDFRLLDRRVVEALRVMPERDRYLRGMVSWIGYRQVPLPYVREARLAGRSHYSLRKLARLGLDGITGFSTRPIRVVTWLGVFLSVMAVVAILAAVAFRLAGRAVDTWTFPGLGLALLGGIQLASLGLVGEYVGQIYREVKHRPTYLLAERLGFDSDS